MFKKFLWEIIGATSSIFSCIIDTFSSFAKYKHKSTDECVYVCCTLSMHEVAISIVKELLETETIACASLFPIISLFKWEGKIVEKEEVKVIIKTTYSCFSSIVECIHKRSGYEIPEIVLLSIDEIDHEYAAWIRKTTKK